MRGSTLGFQEEGISFGDKDFPVSRGIPLTTFEDSISRLGQTAKTIRVRVREYETRIADGEISLPEGVLDELQQLWATVIVLQEFPGDNAFPNRVVVRIIRVNADDLNAYRFPGCT